MYGNALPIPIKTPRAASCLETVRIETYLWSKLGTGLENYLGGGSGLLDEYDEPAETNKFKLL